MATIVIMPRQGQSVESCILTEWFKQVGDEIKKGEPLFAYETDKASFEEEAPEDGILLGTFCQEGDEVPVLQNIAVIGKAGENIDEYKPGATVESKEVPEEKEETAEKEEASAPEVPVESKVKSVGGELRISPRAKKLAVEKGVPFETLLGSGPQGRVIERDVQAYLVAKPKMTPLAKEVAKHEELTIAEQGTGLAGTVRAADLTAKNPVYAEDYEIKKMPHIRKLIAKAMHASLQNSAQLTHHLGADARRIMELRKQVKATEGAANITINDMVCLAVIKALKQFPDANAHFLGDSIKYFSKVHLGLAVDTERGLMVPVIKNADDLSITGLSRQFKEVAEACRQGSIDPELLSSEAASFTVSNLGNYGVEMFTPVINLPQVAILGVNTIVPRPADLGGGVYGFVPYIGLSLTYDHQALDGGMATRFLKQIAIEIENLEIDF
ncbi:pyruvate dehydrogenase E2 component (dihydrolipoamide acetyltransferase) [Saccharicrinis carchari]|uniref:Dihydrolipoamide acetyltransferase component of pyruvate dehydrogenase complex n=1 Tax=Saccharicrinis carchari TaxID=1168039 RepID=A0A521DDC3_SACCC|nr:dihydrolipoamide acetyltransferase family protein [Saccharicrinis carchari]SMO69804.1 pyruvate dehydrogenase E2 component (dihydrolipoamide acetyltransferase) [Saccharicrinis carchari]